MCAGYERPFSRVRSSFVRGYIVSKAVSGFEPKTTRARVSNTVYLKRGYGLQSRSCRMDYHEHV